ncbi:alanine racemase [Balneola vulgaris]|uniref:alanine racemase n=1 Tax=Balneola vulgaris TaxID=287535 RepID=UPI0003774477|nr:alanine racemase [Balneola vulgaris]
MPKLLLHTERALNNIQMMADKASENGLKFRPHFKTHQSHEIGNWFKEYPIDGITVSSVSMAEYFARYGWQSITVAFPLNINKVGRINKLASNIDLRVLAVSVDALKITEPVIEHEVGIYIELDPAYGRSGVDMNASSDIISIIDYIKASKAFRFEGFYMHAGHSYRNRGKKELVLFSNALVQRIKEFKKEFPYPICFGDTPSCSVLDDFTDIDQISPGNFVFYDWIQTQIGSCDPSKIAVAMQCDVVTKYENRNEILIHGGAVHFSKDSDMQAVGLPYFGQVIDQNWEVIPGVILKSVSQEHGIIQCTPEYFDQTIIGESIHIYPIHSCLTADLMGHYYTLDGQHISHLSANYK